MKEKEEKPKTEENEETKKIDGYWETYQDFLVNLP